MQKRYIFVMPLILSGLALNPVMGETPEQRINYRKVHSTSVVSRVAELLHDRGLEEKASKTLALQLIGGEEAAGLGMMLDRLVTENIVTEKEALEYLSQAALFRHKIDFKSYDQMLGMVEKIKRKTLDQHTRKILHELVQLNQALKQPVA